ncbi:MAG: glucose-1-phosphate cytidylyltransferase [Gammaproteobacteria bacterium]|nr:MAG: glucose-1-phosphate cytidylyltransferase [Gammaproteobacteria bacterium]
MKVVILAGGLGTRLSEETDVRPKPMVEIGGKPILWHIMKHYAHYGYSEFAIALGYKGDYIKRWMMEYPQLSGDLTVDTDKCDVLRHGNGNHEKWVVDLVDTGVRTQTGGRIKRMKQWIGDSTFMLTWGDGVSNIDLDALLKFHRSHGKLATVSAVRPPARFGHLEFEGDSVTAFNEKPQTAEGWINGAFFILEPGVLDYIGGDETHFEKEPMERLAAERQLMAYKHDSFWQCMDTVRDRNYLQTLWDHGDPSWKLWD